MSEAKYKTKHGEGLKILTSKQTLQRLPINLLNEIKQIIYSVYQSKEITEKAYNSIMNSVKV